MSSNCARRRPFGDNSECQFGYMYSNITATLTCHSDGSLAKFCKCSTSPLKDRGNSSSRSSGNSNNNNNGCDSSGSGSHGPAAKAPKLRVGLWRHRNER